MLMYIVLTSIVLAAPCADADVEFLARVEQSVLSDSTGKRISRIERDSDGIPIRLLLNGMTLSADDFAAIGRLKSLRSVVLYNTNVADADLRHLRALPYLQGISLSNTEITDAAMDELMKFESLKSLCLGNVAVSPDAVDRLKDHFRSRNQRLAVGYSRRK